MDRSNSDAADTHRKMTRRKRIVFGVVAYVCFATVAASLMTKIRDYHGDQRVYWLGSKRLVDGDEVYRAEELKAFTYPPFFSLLFLPLVDLDEPTRRTAWYFVNILLAGVVTTMVIHRVWPVIKRRVNWYKSPLKPKAWIYFTLSAAFGLRFLISPIEYQGHDLVVFACSLLAIWCWGKDQQASTGIWAGLAAACKATPALFIPVFVSQRRIVASVVMVIAMIAATLTPDVFFPREDNRIWGEVWFNTFVRNVEIGKAADNEAAWDSWNILNQSIAGSVHRLGTPIPTQRVEEHVFDASVGRWTAGQIRAGTLGFQAFVLLMLAYVTWPSHGRQMSGDELAFFRLGQGGVVLCAMLLLSPMTSKQHFCTLIVPLAFCFADYLYRSRDRFVFICLGLFCFFGPMAAKDVIGRPFANTMLAYGSLTWATLLLMLATCRCLLTRATAFEAALEKREAQTTRTKTSSTFEMRRAA